MGGISPAPEIRQVSAVINPLAGSVPEDSKARLQAVFDALGIKARFEIMDRDCEEACERARGHDSDAVIVWGGDGTLACALNTLGPGGPPILPLAGGTMNMLPRMVHDQVDDIAACLHAVLEDPRIIELAAGEVEDQRFYVGALLGGLTRLAGPRESLRKADIMKAVTEFGEADAFSLDTPMRYVPSPEPGATAQALGIFLSEHPGKPGFEILAAAPENLFDLAYTGLTGLLDDWRRAAGVERVSARTVTVDALESTGLEATLDGEPVTLARNAKFELIEGAARLLAARKA
ncbi:MAG: NAD(+)/NADH kinase [Oceanicaulis sp.]|uniref:diacylglycerol/lipid kinase family protein n=1 Tax=Glycocaulis sp. TaxID=1969725 RepID=UPI0025BFE52D|nr:diacylglycerol kinase family protein [Glycocaulis sp.]MCC5980898.1 NAD(+)/NADH kinase [Oceanicaulis sp.]MCH8522541.1 NAD(+)/NADH kinase [Glycocaulis sp.]